MNLQQLADEIQKFRVDLERGLQAAEQFTEYLMGKP